MIPDWLALLALSGMAAWTGYRAREGHVGMGAAVWSAGALFVVAVAVIVL